MLNHNILTFDYELFLGEKSGTVQECIIKPTNQLIKILVKNNIKAVFFIDTTFLIRLKEVAQSNILAKKDYESICTQLKQLANNNQYIFIHLHPHWLDAQYEVKTNTWSLTNSSKYKVASLDDKTAEELFSQSIQLLSDITQLPKQKFIGYRAGGWSIQPFSKFKKLFLQNGIKYEFSVIPGKLILSDTLEYNFVNAPQKIKYYFEDDVCKEEENGSFTQITISTIYLNKIFLRVGYYYNRIKYKFYKSAFKGSTVKTNVFKQQDIYDKQYSIRLVAQFEQLNFFKFIALVFTYSKNNFLHTVSHPKLMTYWDFFYLKAFLFYSNIIRSSNSDFKQL